MKQLVDVLLVKVETDDEGKVTRSVLKRIPDFAFTDLTGIALEKKVLFAEHDAVADAGGPEKVEVLTSRPFCA